MVIPPWLKPADTTQAAESGARIGLADRAQAMNFQQQASQNVAQAQRLDMQRQQLQMEQQQNMMKLSLAKQNSDRQHQLATTELAVQSELKRQQIDTQAKAMAQKFQQQQAYQQTVQRLMSSDPELSPEDAAMKASFVTGFSSPGLASMARTSQPPMAEQPLMDGQGRVVGTRIGNTMKMFPGQKDQQEWSDTFDLGGGALAQKNLKTGEVKVVHKPAAGEAEMAAFQGGSAKAKAAPGSKGKLDKTTASKYLQDAGGDVGEARKQAIQDGYLL